MGRNDINVNPVHIRLRHRETKKLRWMRCKEYQVHADRLAIVIVKDGHFLTEWFSLSEWDIEKTDSPGLPPVAATAPPVDTLAAPTVAFTPRGTANPNAPKTPEEAFARMNDVRKVGSLTAELPGEFNAWAHVDRKNPMGMDTSDPDKAAIQQATLQGSIAAEVTKQEALRKMKQNQARRLMIAKAEIEGFGVEPG